MARSTKVVFMFPGQGAQYHHMARELYREEPTFRRWMEAGDAVVAEVIGESIIDVIYAEGSRPASPIVRPLYSFPALFLVEFAIAQTVIEHTQPPDLLVGYSMGEFVAAVLAKCISFSDALRWTAQCGKALDGWRSQTGMLAVLGPVDTTIARLRWFGASVEVAAANSPSHCVLAGMRNELHELEALLASDGQTTDMLPVVHAFHSCLLDPLESRLRFARPDDHARSPEIPVVSCAFGGRIHGITKDYYWHVMRRPVAFDAVIAHLEESQPNLFVDVGPSGTLANLARQNLSADSISRTSDTINPFGFDCRSLGRALNKISGHGQ